MSRKHLAEQIDTIGTNLQTLIHRSQSSGTRKVMPNPGDLYEAVGAARSLSIRVAALVTLLADRARTLAEDTDLYSTTSATPEQLLPKAESALRAAAFCDLTALDNAHNQLAAIGRRT